MSSCGVADAGTAFATQVVVEMDPTCCDEPVDAVFSDFEDRTGRWERQGMQTGTR